MREEDKPKVKNTPVQFLRTRPRTLAFCEDCNAPVYSLEEECSNCEARAILQCDEDISVLIRLDIPNVEVCLNVWERGPDGMEGRLPAVNAHLSAKEAIAIGNRLVVTGQELELKRMPKPEPEVPEPRSPV